MKQGPSPATEIKLNKTAVTLEPGFTKQLSNSLTPAKATDSVTWNSSNSNASVSGSGLVNAKYSGTAVITAKTRSGKIAVCSVTIRPTTVLPPLRPSPPTCSACS